MARNPNAAGKGPKVTSQGKTGPIVGNRVGAQQGPVKPWSLQQGTNKSHKGNKK